MRHQRVYIYSLQQKLAIRRQIDRQTRREHDLSNPTFTRQALRSARLMEDNLPTRPTAAADGSTFDLVRENLARMHSLQANGPCRPTIAQQVIIEYMTRGPDRKHQEPNRAELTAAFGEDRMGYVLRQTD